MLLFFSSRSATKTNRLLSERHESDEELKMVKQQLDDANLKVKLEKHRCTVSVNRTKVLEKEIEFFKDEHLRSKQKIKELEDRNRVVSKDASTTAQLIQKFRDKVKLASRPNEILKREKDRYKVRARQPWRSLSLPRLTPSHPSAFVFIVCVC